MEEDDEGDGEAVCRQDGSAKTITMNIPLEMRDIHGIVISYFALTNFANGITSTFLPSAYVLSPGYKT